MASSKERLAFRRAVQQLEFAILHDEQPTAASEVHAALLPLAEPLGDGKKDQVAALAKVASTTDAETRRAYLAQFGCAGVQRFRSRAGVAVYAFQAETFPGHINNLYLVDARPQGGGGSPQDLLLLDAGSQLEQSLRDVDRARAVLARVFDRPGALDAVRHVVISHGHIDHFGGVADWHRRGATIYVHPFDSRVLTRFDERLIESSVFMRDFLLHAGCGEEATAQLVQMYVGGKKDFQSVPIGGQLCDGQTFHGLRVYHVPGHCPGQVMLQVDNILLTADHLLSRITPNQSPEQITPWTGLDHYLLSMQRTATLIESQKIDLALGGHEDPMWNPAERVAQTMAFHQARLQRVRELCQNDLTMSEVCQRLFGPIAGYGQLLALGETAAHVEYLARRGELELANVEDLLRTRNPAMRYRTAAAAAVPMV
ncbi:MAG TPA: MBL fold metallo-hydrolase [Pseudomonadota bacterium]|nr:MBL fold metallo-hydrolase [Pseudomonadota bacterium]